MTDTRSLAELYVLHALDDAEMAAITARIDMPQSDEDRELAAAVGSSRERFHELDLSAQEVALNEQAWDRIETALAAPEAPSAKVVTLHPAKPSSPGFWRPLALSAVAAAALLAAGLGWQVSRTPDPLVMAILVNDDGQSVAVVEAYADDSVQVTPLQPIEPGGTKVLQLWTKPDADGPPVSIGVMQAAARARVEGPDLPDPNAEQLYEITIEDAGGSPTGLPTGPIVGKGLAQPTY